MASKRAVRLLSWNVHARPWPYRLPRARLTRIAERVCAEQPDIAVFQEAWTRDAAAVLARGLAPAAYTQVVARKSPGRSSGGLLAFVDMHRWKFVRPVTFREFKAHASPWKFWEGDGLGSKGVMGMHLRNADDGREIVILNTHLQSQYALRRLPGGGVTAGKPYFRERARQVAELAEVVSSYPADIPKFLLGDFNTMPDEWNRLILPTYWTDLTANFRAGCLPCGTYWEGSFYMGWLDYVFAIVPSGVRFKSDAIKIDNNRADDPYSDHDALIVDLQFEHSDSSALRLVQLLESRLGRRAWLLRVLQGRRVTL